MTALRLSLKSIQRVLVFAVAGLATLAAGHVHAQSIVLRHGLGGTVVQGTRLISGAQYGSTAFGGSDNARVMIGVGAAAGSEVQVERGLLRFDLSAFAGKSVAGQGSLALTVFVNENFDNKRVAIYPIDGANAAWSLATATWNMRNQSALTPWFGGPGFGSPGQAYGAYGVGAPASAVLQANYDDAGTPLGSRPGEVVVFHIPQWVLQRWIDDPSSNAGVLLKADVESGGARLFFYGTGAGPAGGYGAEANRPTLNFDLSTDPLVRALERVTPAGGVQESYFTAGDPRLEVALQTTNNYFAQKAQASRLAEARGGIDNFLPLLWKRLRHNGATAIMSGLAQQFFDPQWAVNGMIRRFDSSDTTARFAYYAGQLLDWFPDNSEYRTRSVALANASAANLNLGAGLCDTFSLTSFTCRQPLSSPVEYAYAAAGVAHLDALTQNHVYDNWGAAKLQFMWDHRPNTQKALYAQKYDANGPLDPEPGFTDTDIFYTSLVAYAEVAAKADATRIDELRRVGDYWNENGWRPTAGQFVRKCSFVTSSADCTPGLQATIYGDGMWTTLAAMVVNYRITGSVAYLDRVYQALQLFVGTPSALHVPRARYVEGVAQDDAISDGHAFLSSMLDAYDASGQTRFLDLASSYASFLVQHPEATAPARDSTGPTFLRLMQALGSGVGRLEARFPGTGGHLVVRDANDIVIFDRVVASPTAVLYMGAATYKAELTYGGSLKTFTLPVVTDGAMVAF